MGVGAYNRPPRPARTTSGHGEPLDITLVSPYNPYPRVTASSKAFAGGVERVFAEVAQALARRGHQVDLVCSTAGPAEVEARGNMRIVRRPRRLTVMRAPMADLHKAIRADTGVVQVPATYPFTTPSVLKRAHREGIPSVLDFHFEPDPGNAVGRLAASAYRQLGPRSYPLADLVVVRSMAYANRSSSLQAVPQERWRIIPNGMDTNRFHPGGIGRHAQRAEEELAFGLADATAADALAAAQGDYLLFVGRLVPYKGLEVLLRALALQPAGMPLVVAGDGPLRPQLERLAQDLGVPARFIGRVADADLPDLYRRARLTILPSVNSQEAFGITLLESMACGTPVVASDLPGVGDVARLGGLAAPPRDPAGLAATVRAALAALDGNMLERGAPLAARIHAGYSWEAVTDRFEAVYREAIARKEGLDTPRLAAAGAATPVLASVVR